MLHRVFGRVIYTHRLLLFQLRMFDDYWPKPTLEESP